MWLKTEKNGTYLALVNTGFVDKEVTIPLPAKGKVSDAATGKALSPVSGLLKLKFYPFELKSVRIE